MFAAILLRRKRSCSRKRCHNHSVTLENKENYGFSDRSLVNKDFENEVVLTSDETLGRGFSIRGKEGGGQQQVECISNFQPDDSHVAGKFKKSLKVQAMGRNREVELKTLNEASKAHGRIVKSSFEDPSSFCTVIPLNQPSVFGADQKKEVKDRRLQGNITWKNVNINEESAKENDSQQQASYFTHGPLHLTSQLEQHSVATQRYSYNDHQQQNEQPPQQLQQQQQSYSSVNIHKPSNRLISRHSKFSPSHHVSRQLFTTRQLQPLQQPSQQPQTLQQPQQLQQPKTPQQLLQQQQHQSQTFISHQTFQQNIEEKKQQQPNNKLQRNPLMEEKSDCKNFSTASIRNKTSLKSAILHHSATRNDHKNHINSNYIDNYDNINNNNKNTNKNYNNNNSTNKYNEKNNKINNNNYNNSNNNKKNPNSCNNNSSNNNNYNINNNSNNNNYNINSIKNNNNYNVNSINNNIDNNEMFTKNLPSNSTNNSCEYESKNTKYTENITSEIT